MRGMGRTRTTRLRETRAPFRRGGKVIDTHYEIVERKTIWRKIITALTAVLWAAAIGFALPQVWNFAIHIGAFFTQG